jgi:hypothetical protein
VPLAASCQKLDFSVWKLRFSWTLTWNSDSASIFASDDAKLNKFRNKIFFRNPGVPYRRQMTREKSKSSFFKSKYLILLRIWCWFRIWTSFWKLLWAKKWPYRHLSFICKYLSDEILILISTNYRYCCYDFRLSD